MKLSKNLRRALLAAAAALLLIGTAAAASAASNTNTVFFIEPGVLSSEDTNYLPFSAVRPIFLLRRGAPPIRQSG